MYKRRLIETFIYVARLTRAEIEAIRTQIINITISLRDINHSCLRLKNFAFTSRLAISIDSRLNLPIILKSTARS